MSIENNIARIADALETLVAAVNTQTQVQADPMVSALQAIAKVIEVQSHGSVNHLAAIPVPTVVSVPTPVVVAAAAPVSVEPVSVPVSVAPVVQQPVVVEAPKPVATPVVPEVVQPVAVQAAPAAVSPSNVPFKDNKGLVAYMMDSYRTLGPIKGAEIQGVLASVGKTNINEITPDLYATVFAAVEALKAGA
jgi:hypothetical protein